MGFNSVTLEWKWDELECAGRALGHSRLALDCIEMHWDDPEMYWCKPGFIEMPWSSTGTLQDVTEM